MSGQSFRFIHAAGFHLESPLRGMIDFSEDLLEQLTEAPLSSAGEVLETARREEVDFIVLSGDILDPTAAGPRALTFLQREFSQLHERGIGVYWSASRTDLNGGWIRELEWPGNVHVFSSDEPQRVTHCRGDLPVARIVGRSWNSQQPFRPVEFAAERQESQTCLAVVCERLDLASHAGAARYWAMGGSNTATTPLRAQTVAHCPGSPQGFSPTETGPRGCTLVQVDAEGAIRTRMIATDTLRWCHERIQVGPGMTRPQLRQAIKSRAKQLLADGGRPLLVAWTLAGESRFDSIFVEYQEQEATLEWLRLEFGDRDPVLWSIAVTMEPPDSLPPEWCEEDSILGDYLRVVQGYEGSPENELQLGQYSGDQPPRELALALKLEDGRVRDRVLREAAILGADLLRGDESPATRNQE